MQYYIGLYNKNFFLLLSFSRVGRSLCRAERSLYLVQESSIYTPRHSTNYITTAPSKKAKALDYAQMLTLRAGTSNTA